MITGIHHVALKCNTMEEFEETKNFYQNVLMLPIVRVWPEGVMFDTGSGLIEIFNNGGGVKETGAIRHFALAADNVDEIVERVKNAGYEVFKGPVDKEIPSTPSLPVRIAFCYGPVHEEIEFFQER